MKTQRNIIIAAVAAIVFLTGCSSMTSTTRRAGGVALGSGLGAAAGYAIGDKDPVKTGVGAVLGGVVAHLAMGEDPAVRQEGFDQGYVQGQSDAIKRQYFLRKSAEEKPSDNVKAGEEVYYIVPGPAATWDGRKLEPHNVAVRVVE